MQDFGLHLKNLRKSYNFTQKQLADKLYVSETTIIRWENNYKTPNIESLVQLSKLYHVTLDYIAGVDENYAIVTDDLTDSQIALLENIINEFQSNSKKKDGGLSRSQQEIISDVVIEFNGQRAYK